MYFIFCEGIQQANLQSKFKMLQIRRIRNTGWRSVGTIYSGSAFHSESRSVKIRVPDSDLYFLDLKDPDPLLFVWIRIWFEQICCCFHWSFVCVGCFETPKLLVSILKRNNRNKRLVLDSAETSFGSSFGCFDTKLVSEDTLGQTLLLIQKYLQFSVRTCTLCTVGKGGHRCREM
jgi:hypothetical protein